MADIPTITQLQAQIENDLRSKLSITTTWTGKVALRIIAMVQAAKLKLFYLFTAKVLKNIFVDTADSEATGGTLERFGRVKLGRNPFPAEPGIYTLNVTGNIGGVIAKGVTFKSTSNSLNPDYIFEVTTAVTLTGTTGTVEVIALTAGKDSELQVGDELEATAPIEDVDSIADVDSVDTSPVDAEDLETYRQLIIESFQLEPQGGAATDYRIWSADASGVRTVYPYSKNGYPYVVQVYVEATEANTSPGQPVGTPPASMLTDVEDVIELDPDTTKPINERGRRPLQAVVEVLAVQTKGVTITVNDLSDKTAPTLAAITSALEDLFYEIRPYIPGADGETRNDTLYLSAVVAAIYAALGKSVNFSSVTITIDGTVYASYVFGDDPSKYGMYPYLELLVTP